MLFYVFLKLEKYTFKNLNVIKEITHKKIPNPNTKIGIWNLYFKI